MKKVLAILGATAIVLLLAVPASAHTGSVTASETCQGWSVSVDLAHNVTIDRSVDVISTIPGHPGFTGHHYTVLAGNIFSASGPENNFSGTVTLNIYQGLIHPSLEFTASASIAPATDCTPPPTPAVATAAGGCGTAEPPGTIELTFSGGDGSTVTIKIDSEPSFTAQPADFPLSVWSYDNGPHTVVITQGETTVLDTTVGVQCGGSETPPPPPSSTPPPPPSQPGTFIFTSCTDTFVRVTDASIGDIVDITVNGVDETTTYQGTDIDLGQLPNGTVVTAAVQGTDGHTITVDNGDCTSPTVTPTPSPSPSTTPPPHGSTWTPTWTPRPQSQPQGPTNLAFTGANVTKPAIAMGILLLIGLGTLFWARKRSLTNGG